MPLKVYYIDDEESLCENFLDAFSSNEVEVKTFTDPAQAIEATRLSPPDLIFLDYRLPGTTGDQIAQQLDAKIPKFLITGDITVVTKYKFVKIFPKPYSEDDISEALRKFLK